MFPIYTLLSVIIAHLTVTSESDDEKEILSLLHETNNRLCDQVEIFDAIAANEAADTVGNDRKATVIGQMRRRLEEENEKVSQFPSVSREKRPTPSSAELGPNPSEKGRNDARINQDKTFRQLDLDVLALGRPFLPSRRPVAKAINPSLDTSEAVQKVRKQHTSIFHHYRTLINCGLIRINYVKLAFNIEAIRVEQWGARILHENRSLGFWSLCESILTSTEEVLSNIAKQFGPNIEPSYSPISLGLFSPVDEASNEGGKVAEGLSAPAYRTLKEWLEDAVRQLSYCNDTLLDLISQSMQQSLRRELQIALSRTDLEVTRHLKSASALLGHSDLEQVAKVRILVEFQCGFSVLQDHPPKELKKKLFPNKDFLPLEKAEIICPGKVRASNDVIISAVYRDENVIVQWFKLADGFMEPTDSIYLMRNLSYFAEVLNTSLVPLSLSSAHVLGYFEESSHLFGCVYRLPADNSSTQSPVTLRELLDRATIDTVPELGQRFETSVALAKTVHELHIMGLVHGDIRPENIIFWPTTNTEKGLNLGLPYLIGFDFGTARRSMPRPSSEMEKYTSYPHNESWYSSISECSNNASSDLLGLAGVLFEIGCWHPSSRAKETDLGSGIEEGRSLEVRVGNRYSVAVQSCLFGEIGNSLNSHGSMESIWYYLHHFRNRVVDPIAMCNA